MRRGPASDVAAQWDRSSGWVRPGTFEGVDALVHLSSTSIGAQRWTSIRRVALRASSIDASRVLADHLATPLDRPWTLITASAIGYYA